MLNAARYEVTWEMATPPTPAMTRSPSERFGHAAAKLASDIVVVYGGRGENENFYDAWLLTLSSEVSGAQVDAATDFAHVAQWTSLTRMRQDVQAYHRFHSMHAVGNTVYVFGNRLASRDATPKDTPHKVKFADPSGFEVKKFMVGPDMRTITWADVATDDEVRADIQPRVGHASAVLEDGRIFLFGGQSADASTFYNDGMLFDPTTESFQHLSSSDKRPSRRAFAAMVPFGSHKVLLHGGVGPPKSNKLASPSSQLYSQADASQPRTSTKTAVFSTVFEYDLISDKWTELLQPFEMGLHNDITHRSRHSMVPVPDGFLSFSGAAPKRSIGGAFAGTVQAPAQCAFSSIHTHGVVPSDRNGATFLPLSPNKILCVGGRVGAGFDTAVYIGTIRAIAPEQAPTPSQGSKRKRSMDEAESHRPATRSRTSDAMGAKTRSPTDAPPVPPVSAMPPPRSHDDMVNAVNKNLSEQLRSMEEYRQKQDAMVVSLLKQNAQLEVEVGTLRFRNQSLLDERDDLDKRLLAAKMTMIGNKGRDYHRFIGITGLARVMLDASQSTIVDPSQDMVSHGDYERFVSEHNGMVEQHRAELDELKKKLAVAENKAARFMTILNSAVVEAQEYAKSMASPMLGTPPPTLRSRSPTRATCCSRRLTGARPRIRLWTSRTTATLPYEIA
ncbi:hypothetical protein SPRG_13693 [Saprolegnia parasitica CBS 223.65]|uniref:DUF4110 domain-containing protein n=1 Tax=Saprolegnia parasitica (strain CBS 223.65) TaxID=695850 RepID=A0A067BX07_SAPPC|nr:hypothetical protein SPRG_13693 [Saprolegnia parasitica CBS 223.65]KDO21380.1 hypothetical protein SPRG_13693 [Saprolegnia parasitica CBS 223.65]|eukprot:XP_012207936.1 hypothetical protein SPRG_13693 [Saprolegnia parasitica CBS 223.65]